MDVSSAPQNYWYPIAWSRELKCKPLARQLMGKPIVLFRNNDGVVSALPDRCSHRHAPLSKGKVIEGNIQCPYHGWQFDREGSCAFVPGLSKEKQCQQARNLDPYSVKEQEGLVWVFCSDSGETPTSQPPKLPYYGEEGYISFTLQTSSRGAVINAIENLLDSTHTHFVHNGLIRSDTSKRKEVQALIRPSWNGVEIEYRNEHKQSGIISRLFGKGKITGYGRFTLPTVAELEYRDEKGTRLILTAHFSPIDKCSVNAFITVTHRPHWMIPNFLYNGIIKALFTVGMKQDKEILEMQTSNIEKFDERPFISTEVDLIMPHMYRLFKQAHEGKLDRSSTYPEKTVSIWL